MQDDALSAFRSSTVAISEDDNGECCDGECCCDNSNDSFDANLDYMLFQKKATRIEQARSNLATLTGLLHIEHNYILNKVLDSIENNIKVINEIVDL